MSQDINDPLTDLLQRTLGNLTGKLRVADAFLIAGIDPSKASMGQIKRFGIAMRDLGWQRQRRRFGASSEYAYVKGTAEQRAIELFVMYDPQTLN